jgi:hypothetical protein
MNAKDESRLGFAIFGAGPTTSVNTRAALDSVATAIYKCGLELSND